MGLGLAILALINVAIAQSTDSKLNKRVVMLVTFHAKPEQREALKAALLADKKAAAKEKGNVSIALYQHKEKPDVFFLFERWENQAALDYHFKKPYTQKVFELNKTALTDPMDITYLHDYAPLPKNQLKEHAATDTAVDIIVVFTIKPGMQQTFIDQFKKSIVSSRPESGNVSFFFHTVPADDKKYVLYERWRNNGALQYHFKQPYTVALFGMFKTALPEPATNYLNFVNEIK